MRNFDDLRSKHKTMSVRISQMTAQIEYKENEVVSITDRLAELLSLDIHTAEMKGQLARAKEKRSRLRDECVAIRNDLNNEIADRDWLRLETEISYTGKNK